MAQYATLSELAAYLKQNVDNSTGNLALTIATDLFCERARTRWQSTSITYSKPGTGASEIVLPYGPVLAVAAVRVAGVTLTVGSDYTVIEQSLFRRAGFGIPWRFPPDLVEVDYTYGYTAVPDSVKGAVLETAAAAYLNPDITTVAESIDDYSMKSAPNAGGFQLSPAAERLADFYAGPLVA